MNKPQLKRTLENLLETWENEVIEFKEAKSSFDTDKIGRYFSALANEANLREKRFGWIVLGVDDSTRSVVGTDYRRDSERLQSLKYQVSSDTEPSITFRDIHDLEYEGSRVVMMEVPAAPVGLPIAWKGHYYARSGESLTSLGIDKLDEIRKQTIDTDWSARVVDGATTRDLDETACKRARDGFVRKYANRFPAADIAAWSLETLLDRAKLTQSGQITRTALLLLGKPEVAYRLSPHPAQITWRLEGSERAYEHFGPPFLLSTTELFRRIRNVNLRLLPEDELLSYEVSKYDQTVVLEALHNCIAHQDYERNGRVVVTEYPSKLTFENEGAFFDGGWRDYVEGTRTPLRYRNPFLTQAMMQLNMIDTMGYGIHRMFDEQRKRYFPLPDYGLSEGATVKLTIYGSVVDPAYTRLLMQKTDLFLDEVLALDRVQKKLTVPDDVISRLRRARLIEGRKPNLYVSAVIAAATGNKADYIHTRPLDDAYYAKLLTDYLEQFGEASRSDINTLLLPKLSEALDEKQKVSKINNLLTKWRLAGLIVNRGNARASKWVIAEK